MIDLHYWTTPNGHKITLFLEEYERQGQDLNDFPNLQRWFDAIRQRPATARAYALADEINTAPSISDEESRKILFGQDAATIK